MSDRRQKLNGIHLRVVAGDPIAAKELFELLHRSLWRVLTGAYGARGLSEEQAVDSATDAIAEYIREPQKYDPTRASLFTYLAVVAKRDALNRLRGTTAYARNLQKLVELEPPTGNIGHEDATVARIDGESILRRYGNQIVENETDVAVLQLILIGESNTDAYAVAIGVEGLPLAERKAIVKKYRDKIEKRLQRLGENL